MIIHKLKAGLLSDGESVSLKLKFGLIEELEGKIRLELFFDDETDCKNIFDHNRNAFISGSLSLEATTENGDILKAKNVTLRSFPFHLKKGEFYCWGHLYLEKVQRHFKYNNEQNNAPDWLHFLHLEGMRMKFSDRSEIKQFRGGETLSGMDLNQPIWDYSMVKLKIQDKEINTIWRKDVDDDQLMVVEFKSPEGNFTYLEFDEWIKIKHDFISLISFINGATVRVRAEYTGEFLSKNRIAAHKTYKYSFNRVNHTRYNEFIPLMDSGHNRQENIVDNVLYNCFNNYQKQNNALDLNTIIFYLCNSEQSTSLEEQIFIKTILLERLSSSYADWLIENTGETEEVLMSDATYDKLKDEIDGLLLKHKKELGKNFTTTRAQILNFKKVKRRQTMHKMLKLIEAVDIEVTDDIKLLLEKTRHRIIHYGDSGNEDAYATSTHLDKLLRKIILKLIKYDGVIWDY